MDRYISVMKSDWDLWTIGYYDDQDNWIPVHDYRTREAAEKRARELSDGRN